MRTDLLRNERKAASEMVRAYGEAWQQIKRRLDAFTAQIEEAKRQGFAVDAFVPRLPGGPPVPRTPGTYSPSWFFEQQRLGSLLRQVEDEINQFARFAEGKITEEQLAAVEAAQKHAEELVRLSFADAPPGVEVSFKRLNSGAVMNMVGFTSDGSPLRELLDQLGPDASRQVRTALISGVATGQHPTQIARTVRKALGGNLYRALTISRTEVLRTYRETAHQTYQANADVLEGWVWHSALNSRTCAACWAMHGTVHSLDERLDDHPNGRCAPLPRSKGWEEILGPRGRGIPDTRPKVGRGTMAFSRLSSEEQQRILGRKAFDAYKAGDVKLADFVTRKYDPKWGSMRSRASVKQAKESYEAFKQKRAEIIADWVEDDKRRLPMAVKHAAKREFGLRDPVFRGDMYDFTDEEIEELRPVVRRMYEETLQHFEEQGISSVRLMRGIKAPERSANVLSSWTTDYAIAEEYRTYDILRREIEVERIFMYHLGPGWKNGSRGNQFEYIVISEIPS